MKTEIDISAIICTRNRCTYLRSALDSLATQTLADEQYEILVVDNGSSDATAAVVRQYCRSLKNLRYIYQNEIGLNRARNAGWQAARGEYIAYLDDDAIAESDWLETIVAVFRQQTPRPGCVGGKVEPIWEAPRPSWLPDSMLCFLALLDWSPTPLQLSTEQWLVGVNMAIPREVLQEINGFAPEFDLVDKKLLTGGEIILQLQLRQQGYTCFYHPQILVHHHIHPIRLKRRWLRRRFFWQGVTNAMLQYHRQPLPTATRIFRGGYLVIRVLLSPRQLFYLLTPAQQPHHLQQQCSSLGLLGYGLHLLGLVS